VRFFKEASSNGKKWRWIDETKFNHMEVWDIQNKITHPYRQQEDFSDSNQRELPPVPTSINYDDQLEYTRVSKKR
jgi:hypothetical protein